MSYHLVWNRKTASGSLTEGFKSIHLHARVAMSQNGSTAGEGSSGELTCKRCGLSGFASKQALGGHTANCDGNSNVDNQSNDDNTTMTSNDHNRRETVESACETIANELDDEVANYGEKASLDGSPADIVATAVIRKVSAGKAGYTAMFDPCAVSDCDRGCSGFAADTCDQHTADDVGSADNSGGSSGGNALADLTPEQIAALPESVVADKLE